MGLKGVKTIGAPSFQKLVWENVVDSLAGGLILDVVKADYTDGYVPEGSVVGVDPATGLGVVLTAVDGPIKPLGMTRRSSDIEDDSNNYANGVVLSGTVRIKALPASVQAIVEDLKTALPRITFV